MQRIRDVHDCDPDVRATGIVGVAALTGCYHNSSVFRGFVQGARYNGITWDRAHSILAESLQQKYPGRNCEPMIQNLLEYSKEYTKTYALLKYS